MCANNYLGLADNPEIIAAAKAAYDRWGFGLSSVRFICGTQQIHKELEAKLADFLKMEDAILYSSCFDANGGLFETLLSAEDAVISDELNHASIIDGVRLCKAKRFRYKNNSMEDLKAKLNDQVIGVYFENPGYLGVIEPNGQQISDLVHAAGGLSLVGVDPISLGVLATPPSYGADIVCGDLQPLGIHMNYGGGQSGFMATRDEEKFVMEFPSRLFGIAPTTEPGEYGFGDVAYDRTSFGHHREHGKEYVGTQSALWGITAGVYLATMGPKGMEEVGTTIMSNAQYAAKKLNEIPGVKANVFGSTFFKEFVVDFNGTGKTVAEINKALLSKGIFGGKDLSKEFPALGQSALYCVTEVHTAEDIKELTDALKEILG